MLAAARAGAAAGADLVLTPELSLSGYPPEDLLFHSGFRHQVQAAVERLCREAPRIDLVFGYPEYHGREIFNSAALVRGGRVYANHRKQALPNYRVFDEKRYFSPGATPTLVDVKGARVALLVCEDLWPAEPARSARADGAEALLVINASPFQLHKQRERESVARARVAEIGVPVVYLNLVGGQDELVFDGNSFVMAADGRLTQRLPAWREANGRTATAVDRDTLISELTPLMREQAARAATLIEGARATVDALRAAGLKIASSTGYTREMMKPVLERAAAQGYVPDHLVCSGETAQGRPSSPTSFLR